MPATLDIKELVRSREPKCGYRTGGGNGIPTHDTVADITVFKLDD